MKKTILGLFILLVTLSLAACDQTVPDPVINDATISGVSDVSVALGNSFDRMAGVSAVDHDGSDLTTDIIVSGIVNVNRAGTYEVTYKVTGESGNEVSATRTITVIANASIIGPELLPTMIEVNTPFDPLEGVTAKDIDETDLTAEIVVTGTIINNAYQADTSVPGTYEITYTVTGSSGKPVEVKITITIYDLDDAKVTFTGTSQAEPTTYYLSAGFQLDLAMVATARDYDNEIIQIDAIEYPETMNSFVINNVFKPIEEGTYEIVYKATGKNGNQSETILTIVVSKQGLEIDGTFIPVLQQNINNDGKPWNSVLVYTELKGKGEYGVVVIVDAHGKIILTRDAFGTQFDLNNPIKQGTPEQIRGIANNVGWVAADNFQGLLGPQGTEGGIPEGGFAIFFSRDNLTGTTHPIRLLGLLYAREYGLEVKVINLNIPNFNPPTDDAKILGAEDITIYSDATFDPLEGITGKDFNGTDLVVSVVFNNVDLTRPALNVLSQTAEGFADGYYAIVYEVTGSNGYKVHVTRRVTVLPAMVDAVFTGVSNKSLAVGETFDPMDSVSAIDYDGTSLTESIILEGEVDITTAGVYTLTYKVTGGNGNEVVVTRTITVAADARFVVGEDRVVSIFKDEAFLPFAHIEAFDHDDENLTNLIVLESELYHDNTFDTSTPGTYTLVYKVTGESGVVVELELTLEIKAIPNVNLILETGVAKNLFVTQQLNLVTNASATEYNGTAVLSITLEYDELYNAVISEGVFMPTEAGEYTFTYRVTGMNGEEVSKSLVITVATSGIMVDGVSIPLTEADINRGGKDQNNITIYTALAGMGEFGVLAIVDNHGRIIKTRDAFGEQIDVNNPIKSGNPAFPTNLSGLPNFKTYDPFTGSLWTTWTKGGADTFEGFLGAQGENPEGIPTGGFAIYFTNGTFRALGLNVAREYAAKVEVFNLVIPNYNPALNANDATFTGIEDIEISEGATFDPLEGVQAFDHDGTPLIVSVVFTNVDTSKPIIPGAVRVVNTQIGRDNYAQGWYSVVYSATGSNGYEVHVTRRVNVR